jgi:hypothetical protein
MRTISLTRGFEAIVDEEDFEKINKFSWCASVQKGRRCVYARTHISYKIIGKRKKFQSVPMHRMILGLMPGDGKIVDHINGNGLDNRRANLRICSHTENVRNAKKTTIRYTSKYRGVHFDKGYGKKKWRAGIRVDGKLICLGRFLTEKEAAIAYNEAAPRYFGEFARLNEV